MVFTNVVILYVCKYIRELHTQFQLKRSAKVVSSKVFYTKIVSAKVVSTNVVSNQSGVGVSLYNEYATLSVLSMGS